MKPRQRSGDPAKAEARRSNLGGRLLEMAHERSKDPQPSLAEAAEKVMRAEYPDGIDSKGQTVDTLIREYSRRRFDEIADYLRSSGG